MKPRLKNACGMYVTAARSISMDLRVNPRYEDTDQLLKSMSNESEVDFDHSQVNVE